MIALGRLARRAPLGRTPLGSRPWTPLAALVCALASGACAAPPPAPVALPELPIALEVQATGREPALLVVWDRGPVEAALDLHRAQASAADRGAAVEAAAARNQRFRIADVTVAAERAAGADWLPAELGPPHDTRFDARLFDDVEPGRYRLRVELRSPSGEVVAAGVSPIATVAESEVQVRFLDVSTDLGLAQPLGLGALLAFAWTPAESAASTPAAAVRRELERMAPKVLEAALGGGVYTVDHHRLRSVEVSRDQLLKSEQETSDSVPELPHSLAAQVLVVVTLLGPDDGGARATGGVRDGLHVGLRVFDVSYRRYVLEQEDRRLWNSRPLLFEDTVELDPERIAREEFVPTLIDAWRELLAEVVRDPGLARYRNFLATNAGPGYWEPATQKALLSTVGLDLPSAIGQNFAELERRLLFPPGGSRATASNDGAGGANPALDPTAPEPKALEPGHGSATERGTQR